MHLLHYTTATPYHLATILSSAFSSSWVEDLVSVVRTAAEAASKVTAL
jgi:hypothetical protein